jgi:hypothetical protein
MKLLNLQNALEIKNGELRLAGSLDDAFRDRILGPFFGGDIEIAEVSEGSRSDEKVVIRGTASFPSALKLTGTTEVLATFELIGEVGKRTLRVTLRYTLKPAWRFLHSFPDLPLSFDANESGQSDDRNLRSALDASFALTERYFYLTTHDHVHHDKLEGGTEVPLSLERGLNFAGRWTPDGLLGFFAQITGKGDKLVLHGPVVLDPFDTPPRRREGLFPRDVRPRIPGFHLEAVVGPEISLLPGSEAIKFTNLRFGTYSPLSQYRSPEDEFYEPEMAYLGDIVIAKIPDSRMTVSASVSSGLDDELVFACQFVKYDVGTLLDALTERKNSLSFLPQVLRDAIETVGPESASITLVRHSPEKGYEVASAQFTIGRPDPKPWPLVEKLLEINFDSVRIAVVKPFDRDAREFFATMAGTVNFLGVELDVRLEVPSLYLSAEQNGAAEVSFKSWCTKLGMPDSLPYPPDFRIANISLVAEPGSYYAFAMDIAPDVTWEIADKKGGTNKKYSLPRVRFAVSCTTEEGGPYWGWQFEAGTDGEKGVPVFLLIQELAAKLEIEIPLPAAIEGFTIDSLALSYNSKSGDIAFECWGSLPLNGVDLECGFTIEKKNEPAEARLVGQMLFGGAQFRFDLKLDHAGQEFVATWSNKNVGSGTLDLGSISNDLSGLSDFKSLLMPEEATLRLSVSDGKKKLGLQCKSKGLEGAFLLVEGSSAWIAALGLKPGKISTKSLGPLGDALSPYSIALDELLVVAASADAPSGEQLTFDAVPHSFSKGLFLQGVLKFEETSAERGVDISRPRFSYPFECRLGGDKKPLELPADSGENTGRTKSTGTQSSPDAAPEREKARNNVEVGRTIGPLTFRNARFESRDGDGGQRVYVLMDASLASGGFALDLIGFNLSFPLSLLQDLKDPINNAAIIAGKISPGLDGLSISYSKPPLTISGGFVKTQADPSEELWVGDLYRGHLLVKAATFQITVLGSYGNILVEGEKKSALFLYGSLIGMLGGPPEFFVTGLALGGGYNTRLALPRIEDVAEFPLVQAVTHPDKFAIDGTKRLMGTVKPSYGDYWLAVGVQFTTYKLVDSFALFSVAFGNRLQFQMLGLTKLSMPAGAPADQCAVNAELAIRAVLDPEAGVFSIEGRLTQNSYVLAKELRLTGGFAFFVWFGNAPQAGDFVISLGGYHPDFLPPPHYPLVPRVGIRGQLKGLCVAGEAYLALTPSCVMAGLKLEAVFKTDIILATFVAYADFLIAWAPFHYDARIGIGICIVFQPLRSFKFEVDARLHIWGPPFAGTAYVSIWIISFTVAFGDQSEAQPAPLTWDQFQKAFLPSPASRGNGFNTIRITEGLVREVKKARSGNDPEVLYRIVNPHELMIETDSVVPCTEVKVGTHEKNKNTAGIGIRPMGATSLKSLQVVSIKNGETSVEAKFDPVRWSQKDYPEALWSASAAPREAPPKPDMVKEVPSGVVLRVKPETPKHRLGPFSIEKFKYASIPKDMPLSKAMRAPASIAKKSLSIELAQELNQHKPLRNNIRACLENWWNLPELQATSIPRTPWNEFKLSNTSKQPLEYFQAAPTCAALGQIFEDRR